MFTLPSFESILIMLSVVTTMSLIHTNSKTKFKVKFRLTYFILSLLKDLSTNTWVYDTVIKWELKIQIKQPWSLFFHGGLYFSNCGPLAGVTLGDQISLLLPKMNSTPSPLFLFIYLNLMSFPCRLSWVVVFSSFLYTTYFLLKVQKLNSLFQLTPQWDTFSSSDISFSGTPFIVPF